MSVVKITGSWNVTGLWLHRGKSSNRIDKYLHPASTIGLIASSLSSLSLDTEVSLSSVSSTVGSRNRGRNRRRKLCSEMAQTQGYYHTCTPFQHHKRTDYLKAMLSDVIFIYTFSLAEGQLAMLRQTSPTPGPMPIGHLRNVGGAKPYLQAHPSVPYKPIRRNDVKQCEHTKEIRPA